MSVKNFFKKLGEPENIDDNEDQYDSYDEEDRNADASYHGYRGRDDRRSGRDDVYDDGYGDGQRTAGRGSRRQDDDEAYGNRYGRRSSGGSGGYEQYGYGENDADESTYYPPTFSQNTYRDVPPTETETAEPNFFVPANYHDQRGDIAACARGRQIAVVDVSRMDDSEVSRLTDFLIGVKLALNADLFLLDETVLAMVPEGMDTDKDYLIAAMNEYKDSLPQADDDETTASADDR